MLAELDEGREFYSVASLARLFDVSVTSIYTWLKAGRLQGLRVGGVIRIHRAEVERFIAELREEAAARAS